MTDAHSGANYRYISRPRRTREDGRFITGRGKFVQDVQLDNMKHVAFVASPHPRARIVSIDVSAALALDGVHAAVTGADLADSLRPLYHGVDLPNVRWYPLAVDMTRYVGEWVVALVADDRYIAEDAAELVEVEYDPLPAIVDPLAALNDDAPLVHPDHGSNILLEKSFSWGPLEDDFTAADHELSYQVRWGRSSSVPIETFGVVCTWHERDEVLEIWASIQMPQYQEQVADA